MDSLFIQSYIYQEVIKLGFSPNNSKDMKGWLHQYGGSLPKFWEIDDYPKPPSENNNEIIAEIYSAAVQGIYSYSIERLDKFAVTLDHSLETKIIWIHDMDGKYFTFPFQKFLNHHNQRGQAIKNMTENDVGVVIDSLLVHPTPHQHIKSPIDNHEIRIGGGILNPFQYLFHLRIQLCPISGRREAERARLIQLFGDAIRNNQSIATNELMKVPA